MKAYNILLLAGALQISNFSTSYAIGRDSQQSPQDLGERPLVSCEDKAQACLAQSAEQKQQCLYHFINSSVCNTQPLAKLLRQRWIVESKQEEPGDVNFERCLKSFDSSLYSTLLNTKLANESLSKQQLDSLAQGLNACQQLPTQDILRP